MPKALLLALALTATAVASETDGGHAPPRRWTHPRGPASGSARSLARCPESFGGVLWTYKARTRIVAPPVTWDGVAYLVDGSTLVAVDTTTGRLVGRIETKADDPRPVVHQGSVFLREGDRLVQYRHEGRRFFRRWSFSAGPDAGHARILNGEIYLPTTKGLLRLRAGSRKPAWTAAGNYRGEPAVFMEHVYALCETGGKLKLVMHRRADGAPSAECELGSADRKGGRVMVTDGIAAVLLPPHAKGNWALVAADGKSLKPSGTVRLRTEPMGGQGMLLALTDTGVWTILRPGKATPLASEKTRPDLVRGAPSCVYLDRIICFGTWASNVNANRILWHLEERRDSPQLAQGLEFGAVPAGHELLLVVPMGGKSLCLIGPEEIG